MTGTGRGLLISIWKNSTGFIWLINNSGAIDVKMNGSVLEERWSFKMLGLTCSSKSDWGSYIISIAPNCYLKLLEKVQKQICRTIDPSLAAPFEPLAHCRNVASLSLSYRYYFCRCLSGLAQMVPLPFFQGSSTHYSDGLHDFSVTFPRCYKDVYVNIFFPRTARLWNSVPIECFCLTYDLSGFKFRINRTFWLCVLPKQISVCFNLLCFFFL